MNNYFSEAIESAFRTITNARPDLRLMVFKLQAADAFEFAAAEGIDKVAVADRLDAIGAEFGWSADERQMLIAAAIGIAENTYRPEGELDGRSSAPEPDEEIIRPPDSSDDAIALLFVECNGENQRYVAKLGRWFDWDGAKWLLDETLAVREKVRRTCRGAAAQCGKDQSRIAKAIASAKTVAGVERLAQADRRIAATVEQFDCDEFALNTPAGIVDLKSGKIHQHDRHAYLTKITGAAPDFTMPTPTWDAFLRRITDGDDELVQYLKCVAGYALTGSTRRARIVFLLWRRRKRQVDVY